MTGGSEDKSATEILFKGLRIVIRSSDLNFSGFIIMLRLLAWWPIERNGTVITSFFLRVVLQKLQRVRSSTMIRLYSIIFLSIMGIAIANPLDSVSNPPQRRSNNKGHITCVEPMNQITTHVYNLSSTLEHNGLYIGTNADDFLEVEIDLDAATTRPVNMGIVMEHTWADFFSKPRYTFLAALPRGFRNGGFSATLDPSTGEFAMLGGTMNMTDPGAHVTNMTVVFAQFGHAPYTAFYQSAIWRYDALTRRLTPRWVNADSSTPDIHVFYDDKRNVFGLTGNISAFQELYYPVRECNLVFNKL